MCLIFDSFLQMFIKTKLREIFPIGIFFIFKKNVMKIFYWSPFFSNVATIKAVTRSAVSLIKFPNDKKYKVSLIDAIGEWEQNEDIIKNKISVIKLSDTNLKNYLPKGGFLKSRISYLAIFFWNFFKLKNLINKEVPDYLIIHLMTSLPIFLTTFFNSKTKSYFTYFRIA